MRCATAGYSLRTFQVQDSSANPATAQLQDLQLGGQTIQFQLREAEIECGKKTQPELNSSHFVREVQVRARYTLQSLDIFLPASSLFAGR